MSKNAHRKSKNCKICNLDDKRRIAIERKALEDKKQWTSIANDFNLHNEDIKLTRFNVRSHCNNHVFRATAKILDFDNKKEKNFDNEVDLTKTEIQSLTDFLDLVVEKVNDDVKSGELKPTVAEGVKAAEIKAKIKEDSKFEKELVKFFTQVSSAHGYSN